MEFPQSTRPMEQGPRGRWSWRLAEIVALAVGLVCLATWGALYVRGQTGARDELERFALLQADAEPQVGGPQVGEPQVGEPKLAAPDLSLWDAKRIVAWRYAMKQVSPPPLAVMRIPKIGLEVAVLPGTDEFILDRAVGVIDGTSRPGTDGNSVIAGHRDGFFRGLKDVAPGDGIELDTLRGKETYRIERMWIVDPEDVSVLDDTPTRSLTLVTCYPFYHVGPAPNRYIVRAVLAADGAGSADASR